MDKLTLVRALAPQPLEGERQKKEWCLCRWLERNGPRFCGPISRCDSPYGGFGFPNGQIGDVILFDSEEEAARASAATVESLRAFDVPTRLRELHFWVRAYSHYDGSEAVLYDGGHLEEAISIRAEAIGRAQLAGRGGVYKIVMECRFAGTPPASRLAAAEPAKLSP